MNKSRRPLVDWSTAGCLGRAETHWHVVVTIGPDGEAWPWLIDPDGDNGQPSPFPGHEKLGQLPQLWRERLRRCGAPTRSGQGPCQRTANPWRGGRCHQHAKLSMPPGRSP